MKKTVVFLILIVFAGMFFAANTVNAKKINVIVEGEDEIEKEPVEDEVYIKSERKQPSKKDIRDEKIKELRELVEKSDLEKEMMNAIINKIIDIEAEQDRQDRTQVLTIIGLLLAFAAIIAWIIMREKD